MWRHDYVLLASRAVSRSSPIKTPYRLALGIIIMFGIGTLFDYWGYERWTNSGWNYLRINILENHLAGSSQDPWWYYFKVSFLRGIPPISLPLMIATGYVWIKHWRHPFTWMSLPMFAVHCMIGHKELRYIFPVIVFAGFYFALFFQDLRRDSILVEREKVATRAYKICSCDQYYSSR